MNNENNNTLEEEVLDFPDEIEKLSWEELVARNYSISDADIYNVGSASNIDYEYLENVVIKNADIEDASITSAKIEDAAITNAKIEDATIDKAKIDSLDAGDIIVGTLSGIDIESSDSSDKILLDSGDYLKFYKGGSLKATLRGTTTGNGGLFVEDSSDIYLENDQSFFIQDTTEADDKYGGISITSGNDFWLTLGTEDVFYMKNNIQDKNIMTATETRSWFRGYFLRNDDEDIRDGSGNVIIRSKPNNGRWDIKGDIYPLDDDSYTLGSSGERWSSIYGNDLDMSGDAQIDGDLDVGDDFVVDGMSVFNSGVAFDTSVIKMDDLPTSDPGGSGYLWSDSVTLKVST